MKMIVRMGLLHLVLLGGCGKQTHEIVQPEFEKNGWRLVYVEYNEGAAKDSRFYGMPVAVVFAKDYPFEVGKENPKILVVTPEYNELEASPTPSQMGIGLLEFDCERRRFRQLRTFKLDMSETTPGTYEPQRWDDIPKEGEPLLQYACRPRTSPKK
jgi:hypothetical protein